MLHNGSRRERYIYINRTRPATHRTKNIFAPAGRSANNSSSNALAMLQHRSGGPRRPRPWGPEGPTGAQAKARALALHPTRWHAGRCPQPSRELQPQVSARSVGHWRCGWCRNSSYVGTRHVLPLFFQWRVPEHYVHGSILPSDGA